MLYRSPANVCVNKTINNNSVERVVRKYHGLSTAAHKLNPLGMGRYS